MPVYDRSLTQLLDSDSPTPAFVARAESSSEAAALPNGERALTPILSGAISGTIIVIAWTVAAVYALIKYRRRKKRFKRAGRPDLMHEEPKPEPFILPPDPAIVQGHLKPGDHIFIDAAEEGKKKGKGKSKSKLAVDEETGAGAEEHAEDGGTDGLQRPPRPKRQSTPVIWKKTRSKSQQDRIGRSADGVDDAAGNSSTELKPTDYVYYSPRPSTSNAPQIPEQDT